MDNRNSIINGIMESVPKEARYKWCFINIENGACNCNQCLQKYTNDLTVNEWISWCKEHPNIVEQIVDFKTYSIEDPIEYVISATQIGLKI